MKKIKILDKIKNPDIKILLILFFLNIFNIHGQVLKVTVKVSPPYTNKYSNYIDIPGKISISIKNNNNSHYPVRVWIQATLFDTNEKEIVETDPYYKSLQNILIYPGKINFIKPNEIDNILGINHIKYPGISQNTLASKGLPDGTYYLSLNVYSYSSNKLLSQNDTSNDFIIKSIKIPVIVKPVCGETITGTDPQRVIFRWKVQPDAPHDAKFIIRITGINTDSVTPGMVTNTTKNLVFCQNNITSDSFCYGSQQPLFKPENKYAFTVTIYDSSGNTNFVNNGTSEVCYFKYKKVIKKVKFKIFGIKHKKVKNPVLRKPVVGKYKINNNKKQVEIKKPFINKTAQIQVINRYIYTIKGNLKYKFFEDNSSGILKNTSIEIFDELIIKTKENKNIYLSPDAVISNSNNDTDLYNNYLHAVASYYGKSEYNNSVNFFKIIGVTKTDESGNFLINIVLPVIPGLTNNKFGLIYKDVTITFTPAGDFGKAYIDGNGKIAYTHPAKKTITGDLYRVLRIHINSPFYYSPDKDLINNKNHLFDAGTLFGYVKTYTANIKLISSNEIKVKNTVISNTPVSHIKSYVYRKIKYPEFPEKEGANTKAPLIDNQYTAISAFESGSDGIITFNKLIRNIPTGLNSVYDKHYYCLLSNTESGFIYKNSGNYFYYGMNDWNELQSENLHINFYPEFNDQAKSEKLDLTINLPEPQFQVFHGIILSSDNRKPVSNATIEVTCKNEDSKNNYDHSEWIISDEYGNFEISNPGISKTCRLIVSKSGYTTCFAEINNNTLKINENRNIQVLLAPVLKIHGKIVTETGDGIDCQVRVEDKIYAYKANIINCGDNDFCFSPVEFEIPVNKGKVHLILEADNESYKSVDTTVFVLQDNMDIGTIIIKKNKRKVHLFIYETDKHAKQIPVAKARLIIKNAGDTLFTGEDGELKYEFYSKGFSDNFEVSVFGPNGENYSPRKIILQIRENNNYIYYPLKLEKAAYVSGYVFAGKTPVQNAKIRWENGNSFIDMYALTDVNGYYFLPNIPVNKPGILKADLMGSQFAGSSIPVNVPAQGLNNIDFYLKLYQEMDISQLLGFTAAIDSLYEAEGITHIWGYLANIPSNPELKPIAPQKQIIPFSDIILTRSDKVNHQNIPYAFPSGGKIISDINRFGVLVFNEFNGYIADKITGIVIEENNPYKIQGYIEKVYGIKGCLFLSSDNFQLYKIYFNTDLALKLLSENNKEITEFYPLNSKNASILQNKAGFSIYGSDYKDLHLNFQGFEAIAISKKSRVNNSTINLPVILHSEFINIEPEDISLFLGYIPVTETKQGYINGNSQLKLKLQNWELISSDWSFNEHGLYLNSGKLNMNGVYSLFTGVKIKPSEISDGEFIFNSPELLRKIVIIPSPDIKPGLYYNYELKTWCYFASGSKKNYCAAVYGLPGMSNNDLIGFENISSYSNNSSYFKVYDNNAYLKIYNALGFKPSGFYLYKDFIKVPGNFILNIPLCKDEHSGEIIYKLNGNRSIELSLKNLWLSFSVNGASLVFSDKNAQLLNTDGFSAYGEINEFPIFNFKVKLHKTETKTEVKIYPLYQTFDFNNGKSLTNINGNMEVNNGHWSFLKFSGDISEANFYGLSGKLSFIVNGNIFLEPTTDISVSNIKTFFKNISMAYDIPNNCLTGSLEIKENNGYLKISGMANIRLDNKGWYFAGNGTLSLSREMNLNTSILYGNYPFSNSKEIVSRISQYSYENKFPQMLVNKDFGFFCTGSLDLPVPVIPAIDFNLILLREKTFLTYGANFGIENKLQTESDIYAVDLETYINGEIKIPTVPGIACSSSSLTGTTYSFSQGYYYPVSGDWKVEMNSDIELTGSLNIYDCKKHKSFPSFPSGKKIIYNTEIKLGTYVNNEFYLK